MIERLRLTVHSAAIILGSACAPELLDETSRVQEARILAVRAEPAEAKPGAEVRYEALLALPFNAASPTIAWSYCSTPKSLSENNSVANACLTTTSPMPLGTGANVRAKLPADACRTFGPEAPPGEVRARDPDVTGGYFQPLIVDMHEQPALHLQRLSCNLANAKAETASAFASEYVPNRNPVLTDVRVMLKQEALALGNLPRATELRIEAEFEPESLETYRYFDLERQTLVDKQETLRLSWHADAGTLSQPFTAPDQANLRRSTNVWLTPEASGPVQLWIVLRDSRGGVDFTQLDFMVIE